MKERSLFSHLDNALGKFIFEFGMAFMRFMPFSCYRFFVKGGMYLTYGMSPRLRRNAIESLTIAYGDTLSLTEKKRISRLCFQNLARGLGEYAYAFEHPDVCDDWFTLTGKEHLDNAVREGKGAILAIAHIGPFAAMLLHFVRQGFKTNVIMRSPRNSGLREKIGRGRERVGLNVIFTSPLKSCIVDCYRALEGNELLAMPIDQNYGGAGRVFVNFFGRLAGTAPGVIGYSLKLGSPVLFAYALPEENGQFRIIVEPPMTIVRKATDRETLIHNTAALTARLERLIREHPGQWSWMHKRWKAVPKPGEI
jgi:Kdo2-lipid IVA lauroyltransferase/acyltransferase